MDSESTWAARARSMSGNDIEAMEKCAEIGADVMSPLVGALIGGGLGYAADAIRPVDEDENRLRRRITAILAGAALGGLAGHGAKRLAEVSPIDIVPEPPPPPPSPRKYNPSVNTAIGTTLAALPLYLLTRGKIKSLRAGQSISLLGKKITPELAKAIAAGTAKAVGAGATAAGVTMVARNQLRKSGSDCGGRDGGMGKRAFFYKAPEGTDRSDTRYGLSKATRDRIYANTREDMFREADRARTGSSGLTWQGLVDPVTGEWRMPVSWGSTAGNVRNTSMTPTQANFVSLLTKNKGIQDHRQLTSAMDRQGGGRTWRTAAGAALAAIPLLMLGKGKIGRSLVRRAYGKMPKDPKVLERVARAGGVIDSRTGALTFKRPGLLKRLAGVGMTGTGAGMLAYDNADKGSSGLDFMRDPSVVNLHSGKLTRHGLEDLKFAFKQVHGRDPTDYDMQVLNQRMDRLLGTNAGANGNPYRFEKYLPHTF